MTTAEIDALLDSPSSPLASLPADFELTNAVEVLSRFPAEVPLTVDREAVTCADGMVGPLEQRLAETTAALKRAAKAQDEWAREVARLQQQISTLRLARKDAEKLGGRDVSSPAKPWGRKSVVAGVTCVALVGIIAARATQFAPQERSGLAKQSTVATSIPLVPGQSPGQATLPEHTPSAAQKTVSPNASASSTRSEQARRQAAKAANRPRTQLSPTSSRANDRSPSLGFTGALQVQSNPVSAVFLDRKYVGETPVRLTGLRAGSHVVWIQRDGYQRWTASVLVAAGKQTQVVATLQPGVR